MRAQLVDLQARLEQSEASARAVLRERDQERRRATDLKAQLKAAARVAAAALEDATPPSPDISALMDDTEVTPDVGEGHSVTLNLAQPMSPTASPAIYRGCSVGDGGTGAATLPSPLRTLVGSVQHRASALLQLQRASATLQQQVSAQAAVHAADTAALALVQEEASGLLGDVSRLEESLAAAAEARCDMEAELALAQAALADLQDQLRASAEDLAAARAAQREAESQLAVAQAERVLIGEQLQQSRQELVTARGHLAHAQHHVAEALVEKSTLRQQLATARQQLAAAEAEAARHAESCREAQGASSALESQLGEVQSELAALAAKLRRAQSDAGLAVAARAGLEAELSRVRQHAAACASAASERLQAEMAELQAQLNEAQAGRQLAELETWQLRHRVAGLEAQLAAAEAAVVSVTDAEAQRVADLRDELGAVTAALHSAQAATAAARDAEASQAAAVQTAAITVNGLQATIGQLRRSLAAAEEELQQQRAEAAAAAATNAARAAKLIHELHLRENASTALNASLAEVRAQLGAARADADSRAELQMELTARMQVLQSTLGAVEVADAHAVNQRDEHTADLAQQCESACRAVADLHSRLDKSEASRRDLLAQAAEAEVEQQRLLAQVAEAEEERARLQEALRAAGEARTALEAQVAAGEASLSELQARLHRAEEVLSEALSQLSDANSAVRLLHQRAAGLETRQEEPVKGGALASSAVGEAPSEAEDKHDDGVDVCLRMELAARLQVLLGSVEDTEAASSVQRRLQAAQLEQIAELQHACVHGHRSAAVLHGKIVGAEADRQALQERLAVSEALRQELLVQVESAAAEREQLLAQVTAAAADREALSCSLADLNADKARLELELEGVEAKAAELASQVHDTEAAQADLQAQLSFSNSALQLLQQHLENADAERLDLQAQLSEVLDERRQLRSQLAARLQELQAAMSAMETAAAADSRMLAERAAELQAWRDAGGGCVRRLQEQLAASEAAREELLARATKAEAAWQALAEQMVAAEEEQQALALQAAETAEAAHQALHAALGCADAERRALQAKVRDSEAGRVEALHRLAAAGSELAALQLRLEEAEGERLALQAALAQLAAERRGLQDRLARALREVEDRMGDMEASASAVNALRVSEIAQLQQHCDDAAAHVRLLQGQLAEGEATRRELQQRMERAGSELQRHLERLVAAEAERQGLLERACAAETHAANLSTRLEAASAVQQELRSQLQASDATAAQLRAQLQNSEAAHAAAQMELTAVSQALRCAQQALDDAGAERQGLQSQLVAATAEAAGARDVRSQLAARLTELAGAVALVEATAGRVDELQVAQRALLQRRCEEDSAAAVDLRADLAASHAAEQELQECLAAAEARHQALQVRAAEADAARGVLQEQLEGTAVAREEALARLADDSAGLQALQRRLGDSDREREELGAKLAASKAACAVLEAQLAAAGATHMHDEQRLGESETAREDLAQRVGVAHAALLDLQGRLSNAEESHAAELQTLRSAAAAAAGTAAAQLVEATDAQRRLQEQLEAAVAERVELAVRLAAAEALCNDLRDQLAASSSALGGLQEQLEGWAAACAAKEQQLARTDARARDLTAQLEESETRRRELEARLSSTEAALEGLQSQLADSQRERDALAARLAEAETARSGLQLQVFRFRTQLAAAADSAVIRRMTNATAVQEQYDRLREDVARERAEAAARQERTVAEIASLQAAADGSAVRATVRVALARACLRAVEDERRRLHQELQPLLLRAHGGGSGEHPRLAADMTLAHSISAGPVSPKRKSASFGGAVVACATSAAGAAATSAAGHGHAHGHAYPDAGRLQRRRSSQVASLGGFLEAAADCTPVQNAAATPTAPIERPIPTSTTTGSRPSATDYHRQLEHVRQRLIELQPQTASSLAAVDAALEVPSSFADLVQSAVASVSPLVAGTRRRVDRDQRSLDPLRDSFCMVPDLGSLGSMLDANSGSAGPSAGGAPPAPRQEASVQVRYPPAVPYSTPVTEYRQSSIPRAPRHATTPPSTTMPLSPPAPPLSPAHVPIEAQLAVLQNELHKVEETGRLLGARLEAACQSPARSILETVTAQLVQQVHSKPRQPPSQSQSRQDGLFGGSTDRSPLRHCGAGADADGPDDVVLVGPCAEPLMQLDPDLAPTPPPEGHVVATSLAALRNGIQSVIAQHQQHLQLQPPRSPQGPQARIHHSQQQQLQSPAAPSASPSASLHSAAAIAASLSVLLAHVQVLEDHLMGANLTTAMPTPTGMLLPRPRSPGAAQAPRYPAPLNKSARGGGESAVGDGGLTGRTDGGSTAMDVPSPKTEPSSEPVTTPSDSPLLMATDSPAPPLASSKHALHYHHQQQNLQLLQHHQHHHHHHHLLQQQLHPRLLSQQQQQEQQQKRNARQDLIAADGVAMTGASDGPMSTCAGVGMAEAAAAASAAALKTNRNNGPELPLTSGGGTGGTGRRVAAIHALAYEDSSPSVYSPSLTSLTRAQALPPVWEREASLAGAGLLGAAPGAPLVAAGDGPSGQGVLGPRVVGLRHRLLAGGDGRAYRPSASSPSLEGSDEPYKGPPQHEEWRSESHSPQSLDEEEATVLTATPLACSPAQPGPAGPPPLLLPSAPAPAPPPCLRPPQPQFYAPLSSAAALASTLAAGSVITPLSYSRRCGAPPAVAAAAAAAAGGGPSGTGAVTRGRAAGVPPSQTSSPSTPVSDDDNDDVCVATPLAFAVAAGAAAAATPCLTPQPLDAHAAEQLLRYTNPCFARTPSASELGAGEQAPVVVGDTGGARVHGRRGGYERPPFGAGGPPVPPMPSLGEGLPALEVSESVDLMVLRAARRRAAAAGAGLSAVSIEQAPVSPSVHVAREGGQSMPFLSPTAHAASRSLSSGQRSSAPNAAAASVATASSASAGTGIPAAPPLPPAPQFIASNAASISLYGSAADNGSYKADPPATGLLCLPTRSRRFSFRLPSRQGSRSSMVHPTDSNGSAAADDTASISGSLYQYPASYTQPHMQQHPQPHPSQPQRRDTADPLDPAAGGMPPLPPLGGGKRKKGGLLGKIKRVMGITSSASAGAAGRQDDAGSGPQRRASSGASMSLQAPRPSFS